MKRVCCCLLLISGCSLKGGTVLDELDEIEYKYMLEESDGRHFWQKRDVLDELKNILPLYYRSIGIDQLSFIDEIFDAIELQRNALSSGDRMGVRRVLLKVRDCLRLEHARPSNILFEPMHTLMYAIRRGVSQMTNEKERQRQFFADMRATQLINHRFLLHPTKHAVQFQLFYYGLLDWLHVIDKDNAQNSAAATFIEQYSLPACISDGNKATLKWKFVGQYPKNLLTIETIISKGTHNVDNLLPGVKAFVELSRTVWHSCNAQDTKDSVDSIVKMLTN